MITYSCDWCGKKAPGYEINRLMPRPAWLTRPHPAKVSDQEFGESEVIACAETCAWNIDAALNVPYFCRCWRINSPTEETKGHECRTDTTKPIAPLTDDGPLKDRYEARYKARYK